MPGIISLLCLSLLAGSSLAAPTFRQPTTSPAVTPVPIIEPGQNTSDAQSFIVYNAGAVHYPFTVHPPDRVTRNLEPLQGSPPLLLSLSGSGARGPASEAKELSGYDGASRKIEEYNAGSRTPAHLLAAEEFLTVTPICPNETIQADAGWDVLVFPNIIAQVVSVYDVDLTRIYLSSYSMGARAAWNVLFTQPDIFAGSIISSGATYADQDTLSILLGNSIRAYYGADDEDGLSNASVATQENWAEADTAEIAQNSSLIYKTRTLETIGPIPDADHLAMTNRPWDDDIETDGFPGALSWLLTQTKPEGAVIPAYNSSICTTCIPPPP